MGAPHTGTTIVALTYSGGVILGADSRVSMGAYISNRASDKLAPLADNIWMLRSGSAADTQATSDYVRYWSHQHSISTDRAPTVKAVANLAKEINYRNKHLIGALIVAGWDEQAGGQVFCIPIGGTLVQEKWAADGSGSVFLLGYLDANYRDNMTQEEAEEAVTTALTLAMARDGSSGGMIRLITCNSSGSTKKIIEGDKVSLQWDERDTKLLPETPIGMIIS